MSQAFYSLAFLACPVGMGLMMWFMMRGMKSKPPAPTAQDDTAGAELARLRAEIDQLQAAQRDAKAAPQDSKLDR